MIVDCRTPAKRDLRVRCAVLESHCFRSHRTVAACRAARSRVAPGPEATPRKVRGKLFRRSIAPRSLRLDPVRPVPTSSRPQPTLRPSTTLSPSSHTTSHQHHPRRPLQRNAPPPRLPPPRPLARCKPCPRPLKDRGSFRARTGLLTGTGRRSPIASCLAPSRSTARSRPGRST